MRCVVLENRQLVTKREDLRLQGGMGSKTGDYQSEKGDEKRAYRGSHHHLTNAWNLCVFRPDGVFGNDTLNWYGIGRLKEVHHGQMRADNPATMASLLNSCGSRGTTEFIVCVKSYRRPGASRTEARAIFTRFTIPENDKSFISMARCGSTPPRSSKSAKSNISVMLERPAYGGRSSEPISRSTAKPSSLSHRPSSSGIWIWQNTSAKPLPYRPGNALKGILSHFTCLQGHF
jgi:hypothetical protein